MFFRSFWSRVLTIQTPGSNCPRERPMAEAWRMRHISGVRRSIFRSALARDSVMNRGWMRRAGIAVFLAMLSLMGACERPPEATSSSAGDSRKMPFDRQPRRGGVSPTRAWVPSATKLPEGTTITVRLQSALSSVSAHAGDTFIAALDEPVVIEGQTVIASGTPATVRVLEAKNSNSSVEPGYLRIVLVTLKVGDRPIMIETSSIFAKGGPREEPNTASPAGSGSAHEDIVFDAGRRLTFRIAQTVDLQNSDLQDSTVH